jgi:hypothetical protein
LLRRKYEQSTLAQPHHVTGLEDGGALPDSLAIDKRLATQIHQEISIFRLKDLCMLADDVWIVEANLVRGIATDVTG